MFFKISQNSHENTCARVSFLIKLQALATLLKKRLWHKWFPVNFVKFLRTTLFIEHLWWLLLLIFISKFMMSSKNYDMNIASRGKDSQTMNFGQLIEYKIRNVFLENSCKQWGNETISRSRFVFQKSFIWGKSKQSAA